MILDGKTRNLFRKKAQGLKATVIIGKDGVTEGVAKEIKEQVKKNHLVKVKFSRGLAGEKKQFSEELAERTNTVLIEVKGFTLVLGRKQQ